MTVFKVYELDGHFYYRVNTMNLQRALNALWNTFGDKIRYDIIVNRKQ